MPARARRTHRPRLRLAVVTEPIPPELNGVALTVAHKVPLTAQQGHLVTVLRPRQAGEARHTGEDEQLVPGISRCRCIGHAVRVPVISGCSAAGARDRRTSCTSDEGPLGWAALQVGRRLGIRSPRFTARSFIASARTTASALSRR